MAPTRPLEAALAEVSTLRGFVRRRGVPSRNVDDVLQLVRLRVWRLGGRVPEGEDERRFWLLRIARYVAAEHRAELATVRHLRALEEPRDVAGEAPPSAEAIIEARDELARVLAAAAPHHREVIALVALGLTAGEIAVVLGLTVEATWSRIHKARLALPRRP